MNLWLILFCVWLFIASSFDKDVLVAGAIVSAAIAVVFASTTEIWGTIRWTPRKIYHFIAYTSVLVVEMVRANLNMLRYVYAPRIAIEPAIVVVKTRLKSPVGRLALANSIALTPGSLVLDMEGDTLFIHWLDLQTTDPEEATRQIVGPFEKHLEVVFG